MSPNGFLGIGLIEAIQSLTDCIFPNKDVSRFDVLLIKMTFESSLSYYLACH